MPLIHPDGAIGSASPHVITPPKTTSRKLRDWLATFLDYTSEAPCPHHFLQWAGLATIAGAAQRKVSIESKYFQALSNMYIVLVGPPGSGKSTAIRQGRRLLAQVPGVHMTSDAPSVVGVIDEFKSIPIKEHQSLNAFILEFSSLFENARETMMPFLTAIYDGDPNYGKNTRAGGKEMIPFPWFNLIAGTTPAWLGDNIRKTAIEGGFVARILFIHTDRIITQDPLRDIDPRFKEMERDLIHDLAHISNIYGTFSFTPDARAWYSTWCEDGARIPAVRDNRTIGYFVRKPSHLLKVAMSLCLSKSDKLILTYDDLQIAKAFLESIEEGMVRAFSSVGGNVYANDLERVLSQVRGQGDRGMDYGEVVTANYHAVDKRMLDAILESLVAMGKLGKRFNDGTKQANYFQRGK